MARCGGPPSAFQCPSISRGSDFAFRSISLLGQKHHSLMTISSQGDTARPNRLTFLRALKGSKRAARRAIQISDRSATSNTAFEAWLGRAAADLSLLVTQLDTGPYPYVGIPWFSAPFDVTRSSQHCNCLCRPLARARCSRPSGRTSGRRAIDLLRFRTRQDRSRVRKGQVA